MKYGDLSARSGIYKITNLNNGKVYIGQSKNIFERRKQHFNALYRGRHENKLMQKDWKRTNGEGWRWDVVEYCDLEKLNEREHYWIEHYGSMSPQGYNLDWVPYKRKPQKARRKAVRGYHKTR